MRKNNHPVSLLITLLIFTFTTTIAIGSNTSAFNMNDEDSAPFITTWKSDNPGVSGDTQITIPTHADETYSYNVYWENVDDENHNGTISNVTGDVTIEFGNAGTYRVEITGTFPRIFFNKQGFVGEEGEWEKILLVNQWGDISWSTMESAFYGAVNLDVVAEDAPDLSNVESMRGMFRDASSFNGDIGHWDTSNVTDMQWVFQRASSFNQPIGDWNTENVTNMFGMFSSASSFNQPIGSWETGKVTNMAVMFSGANAFNQPLNNWDTREVTDMWSMFSAHFSGVSSFNQPIGNWDTGKVIDMGSMFSNAYVFNQPIGGWDTDNVTDMGSMFQNAREFNQPIGNWNTEKVTDMNGMFLGAESFNQPLNNWQTGEVTDMGAMFSGAKAFNQPLNNWNTAKVTTMRSMFQGQPSEPYAFNQNLGSWNIGSVTDMQFMFDRAALSISNYDATLEGWANAGNTPSGISLGALQISFCNTDARNTLINTYQWSFIGDALSENCDEIIVTCPVNNGTLFVKKEETGDGSSWGNALGELRDALALFGDETCTTEDVDEIWVSAGTYLPTDDSNDREATFQLLNGVAIYGGFDGSEGSLSSRNWETNQTILSGNIDGDESPDANSYTVVTGSGTNQTAIIDGFTITGGNSDAAVFSNTELRQARGGGMYNQAGSPTVRNSIFESNFASDGGGTFTNSGGGMANYLNSSPVLSNVTFQNNSTASSGGGMYNSNGSSPSISDSRFIENHAGTSGGGMSNDGGSNPTISNSIFSNNTADVDGGQGGGMRNTSSSPILTDVEFLDNRATSGGGMENQLNSAPQLTGVTFKGNVAARDDDMVGGSGGGMSNVESSPTLVNVIFKDNSAESGGGGIQNWDQSSVTLINVIMSGNSANGGAAIGNNGSSSELYNVTITGNTAAILGGGIVNFNESSSTLTNTIVWNNDGNNDGNQIWNNENSSATLNYSLYGNAAGDIVEGGGFTTENSITTNPAFESTDPENTDFLHLSDSSPAIDTGDPATDLSLFPGGPTEPEDLAGNPRVFNLAGSGIIDMGAYEFQGEGDGGGPGDDPEDPEFAPFITTWEVDGDDLEISIPMIGNGYDFNVDWGDGNDDDYNTNPGNDVEHSLSHTYASAGTYTVSITGDFPRIYFLNADDQEKILSVDQWGDIVWSSMEWAFDGATNLDVVAEDAPDLSSVTNMANMFRLATSMNGDINHWDTKTITNMEALFSGAELFNQDLDNWDTGSVTSMRNMFLFASDFNGDITSWNTEKVENMDTMFNGATAFNQDISGWDVSNVKNMQFAFRNAVSFDQDLGGWDISAVESMMNMLDNSGFSTENYDATLIGWAALAENSGVQSDVELGAAGLTYCNGVDARQFLMDDYNWSFTGDALSETCGEFRPFITTWKTDNEGESDDNQIRIPMIGGGYDFTVDWGDGSDPQNHTANPGDGVTHSLEHTYSSAGTYTVSITGDFLRIYFNNSGDRGKILDVSQWGDIEWQSMESAFYGAGNLNVTATDAPDLSQVTSLRDMFREATVFNGNIGHWNTESIESMESMFRDAPNFNADISAWQVANVTDMHRMFQGAAAFNQELGGETGWNTGKVIRMSGMFREAAAFNGDISNWNTSSVTTMRTMFREAVVFNQDISGWDVSNVEIMIRMFIDAETFDQDLSSWNISNIETMEEMFENSGLSTENYDATLIGWAALAGDSGVQSEVELGAAGLTYCAGANARDILMGGPHNWEITGDALSETCGDAPVGEDQRVLAANNDMYTFSGSDFGLAIATYSVKIESLPANSSINRNIGDELTVAQLNDGALTYDSQTSSYGYGYDSFEFTIVDGSGTESEESYTMTIDLGSAFAELSGSQGWRFMSNPSAGDSYSDLFSGITVQTNAPSSQTLYELDQENYEWDPVGSTGDEPGVGTPFIIYALEQDLPTTVESGDNWNELDGSFSFAGLDYDAAEDEPNPDDFYLLGNPHPIALDFCQFEEENIATSAYFWDPEANGGNGDYLSLNCAAPEDVLIAPFQAFWIRTTGANPSLEIPVEAYVGNTEPGYFKDADRSAKSSKDFADLDKGKDVQSAGFVVTLNVTGENGLFTNRAQILFADEATAGLDRFDAPKLSAEGLASQWLSFHSLDENQRTYAFQSLPASHLNNDKVRIPLDIQTTESGRFTMDWTLPESHMFNGSYFLRDNDTGEVIELREGSSYSFDIDPAQTSKVSKTLEVSAGERSAKSPKDFADLEGGSPRFELLIAGTGVDGFTELGAIPEEFELAQNYPNPFNPATVISYQLPASSEVRLEVYDMLGRRVASLVEGHIAAGRHTVNFDASGLSSGVYLYRLQAGNNIMTKKLTVVK